MSAPAIDPVKTYLLDLQDRICAAFEEEDGAARFAEERIEGPGGTLSRPRVLSEGPVIEKSGVMFTHSKGPRLPPAATERRPELAGRGFEAVSLSLIVHPRNPYVPTTHMNVRFFLAGAEAADPIWWIGGGFDLTPFYPFRKDVVGWHEAARAACQPFGAELYPRFKKACDAYFYLPHRGETRGVGGIFYDDFDEGGYESCFGLMRSVGDHFLQAYRPILSARKTTAYGERERAFQLLRRGRYAEFNLVYDRGTKYGLQSGRRIESVLASMPPAATWVYAHEPEPGSPEADLYDTYLKPQDWLATGGS